MRRPVPVDARSVAAAWVILSAWLAAAGWGLSWAQVLGPAGYGVIIGLAVAAVGWLLGAGRLRLSWRIRWRRYRRIYPMIFLGSWLLAMAGGLFHAPNNIDAMTYRLPRVLHWLSHHGWHWIDTVDPRMNYSACGQEWLMAPLVSLTGSDRWTWIWNALAEALMPGLLFIVLRGLRVAGPVAWRWMWLLPLAPVYLLQAGSVANDILGTAYFLSALALGLHACRRNLALSMAVSVLSMGLATAVKSSNLPLVLPWLVLVSPALWRSGRLRRTWLVAALPALLVSAAPTLALNRWWTGTWTGDPGDQSRVEAGDPWSGLVGNTVQGVVQNLQPPVFPFAERVESALERRLGIPVRRAIGPAFPRFSLHLTELAQEEWTGVGGLICLLLLAAYVYPRPAGERPPQRFEGEGKGVMAAAGIAGLAYFSVMASEMTARLLAPYYPLAVTAVLRGRRQPAWTRSRGFALLAGVAIFGSLTPLFLSPARPLMPMSWLLRLAEPAGAVDPGVIGRARTSYAVYASRADDLHDLCAAIPAGVKEVGFMATADDSEISCWRPLGSRRVATVRPADTFGALHARGIGWLVIRADAIWPTPAAKQAWLTTRFARVVAAATVRTKARRPQPEAWLLVHLEAPGPAVSVTRTHSSG